MYIRIIILAARDLWVGFPSVSKYFPMLPRDLFLNLSFTSDIFVISSKE